jgi:uncharacterized protein (TIGR04222 family)
MCVLKTSPSNTLHRTMKEIQPQLYQRICAYELNDPSHEIGFLAHLMRANGWSRPLALGAIEEYRKFVFLALVADHPVTPSDQVDQVWHLHLLFSDAYWNDFCPRVLGRPLHHHPTKGGQAERDRFHELYRATIRSYRQHFGEPPADLWPPVDVRFGRDLQMQRGRIRRPFPPWRGWPAWRRWRWSVPMGGLLIGLGVIGSALASAATETSTEPVSGSEGLLWLLASTLLAGHVWIAFFVLRPLLRQPSEARGMPALNVLELAYLARGPGGALQAALASLVQSGVLLPNRERRSLVALGESEAPLQDLAQQMVRVHHTLRGRSNAEVSYQDIINPGHYDFTGLVVPLQSRALLLQGLREVIALAPGNPVARFVVVVAVAQYLFALLPAVVWLFLVPPTLAIILALFVPSGRTLWAERVLEYYRIATIHGEALRRVALLGPEAMTGGRLDDLRSLIKEVEEHNATACGC